MNIKKAVFILFNNEEEMAKAGLNEFDIEMVKAIDKLQKNIYLCLIQLYGLFLFYLYFLELLHFVI